MAEAIVPLRHTAILRVYIQNDGIATSSLRNNDNDNIILPHDMVGRQFDRVVRAKVHYRRAYHSTVQYVVAS